VLLNDSQFLLQDALETLPKVSLYRMALLVLHCNLLVLTLVGKAGMPLALLLLSSKHACYMGLGL
jgi:hypothetical protein